MVDPILSIRLSIQCRRLDVDVLVRSIEVHIPNRCGLVGQGMGDGHAFEVRRGNEVDVLARVREQSHH